MKKLEKNVLHKIYVFETKKIIYEIVLKLMLLSVGILALWIFTQAAWDIFDEQGTFGILMSFKEDFNEAMSHIDGIISAFYQEAPKVILLLIVCLVFFIGVLIFKLFKERNKLKNKIKLLIHFWLPSK